jgi:glutamyl-tRNA reductase
VTLLAVGVSHRSAPLAVRERFSLTPRRAAALLAALAEHDAVEEAAALSTCNRTELYVEARDAGDAERAVTAALARAGGMQPEDLRAVAPALRGTEVARHLFRVAAGLESMVPGEPEIQGQVKRGYELASSLGTSGQVLNHLFQDALRAGKRVRCETGIARHGASIASVALGLARRELGALDGRRALVIGAGKQGALTARALRDAGVGTVFVANRAHERAEALAQRFGGKATGFDDLAEELDRCDLVLASTSCPHPVVSRVDLARSVRGRKLVVLDLAVPRDVEPSARSLPGVTLYDLDDIQRQIARNLSAREQEAVRAEPIIDDAVARFERWLATLAVVPTISALHDRGRAAVERALRDNEPRWQSLTADDRARVERIAGAIVSDLLHEPTLNLRRAGEQGTSSLYVRTVRELFGLST